MNEIIIMFFIRSCVFPRLESSGCNVKKTERQRNLLEVDNRVWKDTASLQMQMSD